MPRTKDNKKKKKEEKKEKKHYVLEIQNSNIDVKFEFGKRENK